MENIKEVINELTGEIHIIIDHGNEQFTSMTKAHYEAQQVKHLTEIATPNEA